MKVLYLTHRVPFPPNRGDRLRSYQMCRALARSFDVHVVSLAHDSAEMDAADALARDLPLRVTAVRTTPGVNRVRAVVALAGTRPLTHCLLDSREFSSKLHGIVGSDPPDVVLAYCSGMARFALEPPIDRLPMVLDFVDIDSEKWASLGATRSLKGFIYRREAKYLARFEATAARRACACLVVNERERETLVRLAPEAKVHVVGVGVELERMRPPGEAVGDPVVVFCGVMNYMPNVDGIVWFVREVWPIIRTSRPDARFVIVGSDPSPVVQRLGSNGDGITVTGTVPDVRHHLWNSAVSVAPLLTSRGVQTKVLEALAAGLPVVVTPGVFEGLPAAAHAGCRVAADAKAFAEATLRLLAMTAPERRELAASVALHTLGWLDQLSQLPAILRTTVGKKSDAANSAGISTTSE